MNKELLCPHCFRPSIIIEDRTDSATCIINGQESLVEKYTGYCDNCGRFVEWETCYTFVGYRNEKAYIEE